MRKHPRLSRWLYIGLLLLSLPVSAFGADRVTLQLIWKNQFQFAGYYVARELGFYEDVGLDVTIKAYEFGKDVTEDVVSQEADFGVGRSSLILEHMEGQPVLLLSAILQHSPFVLLAQDREDLQTVADLKNKRIMVTDDVVGMASLTAMLTGNGIKSGEFRSQKHTFAVDDLISGKTDAIAAYTSNEPFQMQKQGVDYKFFTPRDHGFDFYSDILFTSQKLYQDNPQLVDRFNRASLRGWDYAFDHIDEAVDIILKHYNTQNRSREALRFEADTLKKLAYDGDTALGRITRDRVAQIAQVYRLLGYTTKPLNMDDLIYDTEARARTDLTPEEQAWLAEHQTIRFTGDPDWLPQEAFTSDGQYIGIVADILDLIEARLGIRFERVPVKTWDEAVRLAESAEVDVLSETTNSERETLTFTNPYLDFSVVIIAEQGTSFISDPGELKGKRVAVVKDYGYVVPFRAQFPDFDYVEVETVRDGLMRLSAGEVDVFVSAAPSAYYLMSELGLMNLKVVGSTGLFLNLGFGVRKDMPVLVRILNKALAGITEEEKFNIRQKWVPTMDTSAPQAAASLPYQRLMIYGGAVFLSLGLLAWILIRSIRRENIAVSFGSPWFRGLVLTGLSIFVLIVAILGWTMLERNKTAQLLDVDENLRGILSISEDRINLWLQERRSYLARLGRDPALLSITQRLLQVEPNKRALLASDALREARFFFQNVEDIFPNIGFFVIGPEHVSIGAMRDANLGTRNRIAKAYPELIQQAFQGQVRFLPPTTWDEASGNSSKSERARKPPTMFFIGPVQDMDGQVLAVMILHVDPWKDFARALKFHGSWASRESYAFDRHGVMLSSSQFDAQLRRIGLLTEGQSSALNIEIRDPGGNMVAGYRPRAERSQQPLTQMVSSALALRRQMEKTGIQQGPSSVESNIQGYRDYRGVPVFGAWLWNADLDMGFAAEIDVDEALLHYYRTRTTIFSILGFTLLLSVGAILFVLIIGERTSRALMRARDNLEKKVTERTAELQANQQALESAVERSRLLLDSAGEGIFGVDLEGNVAFINPAACRMLGYASDDLIGLGVHEKIHHTHADGTHYPKQECPMFLTYRDGSDHNIIDEVLWCKDGRSLPVEYTSMPIRKDGQVVGAVVTFMDVTERRAMEEQLEATKSQLQHILDTSPIGVAFSTKGKIHFANPRFKEMFGVGVGDDTPNLYVNQEDREALVRELKENGKVENRDLQMYNGDHEVRDMLITYLPITYDGAEGILGWLLDITDRKLVEKEIKEKYEDLNRFRKIAIGRELKMIELKKEINELFKATGKSERYKIH